MSSTRCARPVHWWRGPSPKSPRWPKPGVSTAELDALAEQTIRDGGAEPSFKGYHGYPASICASVNEQIVHGIPSATRVLADGDLISVDCGAVLDGWHGDAAVTIPVGEVSAAEFVLSAACEAALWAGHRRGAAGGRLSDISYAVQSVDRGRGERTAPTTASSPSTAATASARRCTWTRSCPTTATPATARGCGPAWRSPSSP